MSEDQGPFTDLLLRYTKPAEVWTEALPVGNGRMGAMVFGGVEGEHLQLNEETLWAGGPYEPGRARAGERLEEARKLVFAGEYRRAQELVMEKMMAEPIRQMCYQTLGDLCLDFEGAGEVTGYARTLDLDTAVAETTYQRGGVRHERQVFCSAADQVLVVRLSAGEREGLSFDLRIGSPHKGEAFRSGMDLAGWRGRNGEKYGVAGALRFAAAAKVIPDGGTVEASDAGVRVRGARGVTLLLAMATSYRNYRDVSGDPEALVMECLEAAGRKSYEELHAAHVREHQRLFRRASISLPGKPGLAERSTEERVRTFQEDHDPALVALYYQFGRYLLICSSRPGGQPANLQGIWCDSMDPPWGSKYTVNINTEMNYWPAEMTNLAECHEPLLRMVEEIAETGRLTARFNWRAKGWVCHHNTDLWRGTAPIDGPGSGFWPTGGAWLCRHLWEHYEYGEDREYLGRIYPVLKGAAEFLADTLVEDPGTGWMVTCPSVSPENTHREGVGICAGPSMDMQITRGLLAMCIKAGEILGVDGELREQLTRLGQRTAPPRIGKAGQLQEWQHDWDMEAPERTHRHVSHLYALHPAREITPRGTPELAAAARRTLELRGDDGTGWSLAWKINFWARLLDGEHAYRLLVMLLGTERTYPNLFDAHPPFQIDGNFGAVAGITEMLLQCEGETIEVLPALPRAWADGEVRGLRAKGGVEVGMRWEAGQIKELTLRASKDRQARLRAGTRQVVRGVNEGIHWRQEGEEAIIYLKGGEEIEISFS